MAFSVRLYFKIVRFDTLDSRFRRNDGGGAGVSRSTASCLQSGSAVLSRHCTPAPKTNSGRKHPGRQISIPAIANDADDDGILDLLGDAQCHTDAATG